MPPAPLSTINKSASTMASPISVPPSISNAAKLTLLAVDIVSNFESAIAADELISALTITPDPTDAALEFASTYVTNLEAATFLLVPPAPLSTTVISGSTFSGSFVGDGSGLTNLPSQE